MYGRETILLHLGYNHTPRQVERFSERIPIAVLPLRIALLDLYQRNTTILSEEGLHGDHAYIVGTHKDTFLQVEVDVQLYAHGITAPKYQGVTLIDMEINLILLRLVIQRLIQIDLRELPLRNLSADMLHPRFREILLRIKGTLERLHIHTLDGFPEIKYLGENPENEA